MYSVVTQDIALLQIRTSRKTAHAGHGRQGTLILFNKEEAMKAIFIVALLTFLGACASNEVNQGTLSAAREEIAQATNDWVAAYDSRNASRLTALYAPDAALWGTISKAIATSPSAIAAYFKNVGDTPQNRVVMGEQHIRVYGDIGINSGTYTFNNVRPDGSVLPVAARYSMVFRKQGGKWMIVEHHSSRLPN